MYHQESYHLRLALAGEKLRAESNHTQDMMIYIYIDSGLFFCRYFLVDSDSWPKLCSIFSWVGGYHLTLNVASSCCMVYHVKRLAAFVTNTFSNSPTLFPCVCSKEPAQIQELRENVATFDAALLALKNGNDQILPPIAAAQQVGGIDML